MVSLIQKISFQYKINLYQIINKIMETITLQGIKLQNYHAVPFQKDIVKTIDLEVFTPKRVHYLVNALVNNTKLPSQQAMIRSQKRNQTKSGADKADQVVGRPPRGAIMRRMHRGQPLRRGDFHLPQRYGRLPVARRNRGGRRGRGRLPQPFFILPSVNPPQTFFILPSVNPPQTQVVNQPQSIQVENNNQELKKREEMMKKIPEVVQKRKKVTESKQRSYAFKTHDPEWIALKAYKAEACQFIEKYREEVKKDKQPIISENLKDPVPLYFQKKKANQKRRRQQKHELIKKNRKALKQIFGNAIFKRGWPISRKQIKAALGILQQESMDVEKLSEFIGMAEKNESMSIENQSSVAQISEEEQH